MSSLPSDIDPNGIMPDFPEEVDSFSGMELLPLTDELAIMPYEKFGWWWFIEIHLQTNPSMMTIVRTHGPYADDEQAIEAGMNLV